LTDKKPKLFSDLKRKPSLKSSSKLPDGSLIEYDFVESFKIDGMPAPNHSGAIKNPDFINEKFTKSLKSHDQEQIKLNINDIFKKFLEGDIILDQNILITENKLPQIVDYSKIGDIGYLRSNEPNEKKEKFQNKIIAQIIANNIDDKISKHIEFENKGSLISKEKVGLIAENACKSYISSKINPISTLEDHESIFLVDVWVRNRPLHNPIPNLLNPRVKEYQRKKGLVFGYYYYNKDTTRDMRIINKYNFRSSYYKFYASKNDALDAIENSQIINFYYDKIDRINQDMGNELHLFLRDKNCLKETINQIYENFREVKTQLRFFSKNIELGIFEVAINKAIRNYKDFLNIVIKNDLQVRATKILYIDYGIEVDNFFNEHVKKSISTKIAIDVLTTIATKREN
jgi:hypothetical protein